MIRKLKSLRKRIMQNQLKKKMTALTQMQSRLGMKKATRPHIAFPVLASFLIASCDGLSRFKHVSFTCMDNRLGIKTIELYVRSIDKRVVVSDKNGMREINPISLSDDMLEAGDQELKILINLETSKVKAMTNDLFFTLSCGKQEFEM